MEKEEEEEEEDNDDEEEEGNEEKEDKKEYALERKKESERAEKAGEMMTAQGPWDKRGQSPGKRSGGKALGSGWRGEEGERKRMREKERLEEGGKG